MGTNTKTTYKFNLTGDNDLDRRNIFTYVSNNYHTDKNVPELLVLASTFLSFDSKEILKEIKINPDVLVPVCLELMREPTIDVLRRSEIGTALVRFSDAIGKNLIGKNENKPLFNLTNEYEIVLFKRFSNQDTKETTVDFPFFMTYFNRGLIFEQLGDYENAYRMYSKAHQWNPLNPKAIIKILEALKHDKRSMDLIKLSQWFLQIVYSLPNISTALRYCGYGLYLNGEFEKAYAYYFQSIVYDDGQDPTTFNNEINAVLLALGKDRPYELTRAQIKKIFANSKEKPFPSEVVLDTIRILIIKHYKNEEYVEVLRYATHYTVMRPSDEKIMRILRVSKINLN